MNIARGQLFTWIGLVAVWVAPAVFASTSSAAIEVVFTLDPTNSSERYSAFSNVFGPYGPTFADSDTSSISGHFLVSFDPLNDNPTSIQFIKGDGYFKFGSNLALQNPNGGGTLTFSNLSYDFHSPVLTGSGGVFTASSTTFNVLSGIVVSTVPYSSGTYNDAGFTDTNTAGQWTLAQMGGPGSGDWTLGLSGYYTVPASHEPPGFSETFTFSAVATAHFGLTNINTLAPTDSHADVLGGASIPGGVSINLAGNSNGGTFTAQQIPNTQGLSQQAVAASAQNSYFIASTGALAANPQIWKADYTGLQAGQTATLVFHYDPSLLPNGTNEATLGIWHFNATSNSWEFGGDVNTVNHTIAFTTDNFSPFELGVAVATPEPASLAIWSLIGLTIGGGCWWRRKRLTASEN